MAEIIIGARLQRFAEPGSMGVVSDTQYVRCFWAKLDVPTALFAEGSAGIVVEGPPTPRNVIFPKDTVFTTGTKADCFFVRHKERVSPADKKARFEEYVAELPADIAVEIAEGKIDVEAVKAAAEYVPISASREDPSTKKFRVEKAAGKDALVEVVKARGKR